MKTMKTARGLVVVAAELFLFFGGLGSVTAQTCGGSGWGTCDNYFYGPVDPTTVCGGTCDETTCCVWHEDCSQFSQAVCTTATLTYVASAGQCNGACLEADCCATPTCGNTFDYSAANACAKDEGPADPTIACSGGVCTEAICCASNESCNDGTDADDCLDPLWWNSAATCDGTCAGDGTDYSCCSNEACATDWNERDCAIPGDYTAGVACDGTCDEATCCPSS